MKRHLYTLILSTALLQACQAEEPSTPSPNVGENAGINAEASIANSPIPTQSSISPEPSAPIPSTEAPLVTPSTQALPTQAPFPEPSATPESPSSKYLLNPKDTLIIQQFKDQVAGQGSALEGLLLNNQNQGLIYWRHASNGTLQGRFFTDTTFDKIHILGSGLDSSTSLQIRQSYQGFLSDTQKGSLFRNLFQPSNVGLSPGHHTLSQVSFENAKVSHALHELGNYTLYDVQTTPTGEGWLLFSNRTEKGQLSNHESLAAGVYRLALEQGQIKRPYEPINIMSLPQFYEAYDFVKGAVLETDGSGGVVLNNDAATKVVWQPVRDNQATGEKQDLKAIPANITKERLKLKLIGNKGYIGWDTLHFLPIQNGRVQDKVKSLPITSQKVAVELNAQGRGMAAWIQKANEKTTLFVQEVKDFELTAQPFQLTWDHPFLDPRDLHIALNDLGHGFVVGLNAVCNFENTTCPEGTRLGREIWARKIQGFQVQ